jgi:hypothetical protein
MVAGSDKYITQLNEDKRYVFLFYFVLIIVGRYI